MPPSDLHVLYTIMGVAGAAATASAIGLAMLGSEDSITNKKTIKRVTLPVDRPRSIKPTPKTERCYGSARRLVEVQKQWKLAHAPAPAQPVRPDPANSAAEDVFVHWFENCIDIPAVKSPNDAISYEDLDASYLTYCQEQQVQALDPEDFARILASYSTSQGCKFDPDTGELTHGRLKG